MRHLTNSYEDVWLSGALIKNRKYNIAIMSVSTLPLSVGNNWFRVRDGEASGFPEEKRFRVCVAR